MRDPERIKRILSKLEKTWSASNDLRLGQLLLNLQCENKTTTHPDFFYAEDEDIEAWLDKKNN